MLIRLILLVVACICATGWRAYADTVVPSDAVTTRTIARANATSSSAQVGSLLPNQSAELLGEVPNWYRVRLPSGVEGYMSKRWTRLVSVGPAPGPFAATPSFTIDVVDVGTGLAVLVRGQEVTLVYDAGSNDDDAVGANNRMLAFMRVVEPNLMAIDHLSLSHPHQDHVELRRTSLERIRCETSGTQAVYIRFVDTGGC